MDHQTEHRMEVRRHVSRIEVLEGGTGRRCWPDDVKARIVAETFLPGARVCDVAARYGIVARHLSTWRSLARKGLLALPAGQEPAFVPLMLEASEPMACDTPPIGADLRIEVSGVVLHVPASCSAERAASLTAALRRAL